MLETTNLRSINAHISSTGAFGDETYGNKSVSVRAFAYAAAAADDVKSRAISFTELSPRGADTLSWSSCKVFPDYWLELGKFCELITC